MAMTESHAMFDKRLKSLDRKHQALARGYTPRVRDDGLIVLKPRRRGFSISPRAVLMAVAGFFLFKAFMVASLGTTTYDARVDRLAIGTPIEQGGAWVMQIDPVTQFVAGQIGPYIR